MPNQKGKVKILGRYYDRARAIAAWLLLAAFVLIVVGIIIEGPIGTILAALGSTLGTTGVVSFIADPVLKDLLAQEIFDRVGLRDSIVAAGLEDIGSGEQLQIAPSLMGSRRIVVAPLDPFQWAREDFPFVLEAVTVAEAAVIIILPSPKPTGARRLLADRLRMEETELERKLATLNEDLLKAWDRTAISEGSTLALIEQEGLLSCGLLVSDATAVIEMGPALRQSVTDRLTLAQRFAPGSTYWRWASQQLEDMIESGTPGGVRPVTAPSALPGRRSVPAAIEETSVEDSDTSPAEPTGTEPAVSSVSGNEAEEVQTAPDATADPESTDDK